MHIETRALRERAVALTKTVRSCRLCPRRCGVDRAAGQVGRCGIGHQARVAGYGSHFGEERPLVGRFGSGTVFFSGCNLACCTCQN